jgi:hypothetical protein
VNWEAVQALAAISAVMLTFISSIFGLGYWLSGRFRKIEEAANERHIENLQRFGRINLALVQLGFKNGEKL